MGRVIESWYWVSSGVGSPMVLVCQGMSRRGHHCMKYSRRAMKEREVKSVVVLGVSMSREERGRERRKERRRQRKEEKE